MGLGHPAGVPLVPRMVAKLEREQLRGLVEPHWRRLYNFMFRLTLDRDRAERYLVDVFNIAVAKVEAKPANPDDVEVWLLGIANQLAEERLPRQPEVNFDILDETLRSESTRTDVVRSLSDPQRAFRSWRHYDEPREASPQSARRTLLDASVVNFLNPNAWIGWSLVLGPLLLQGWREAPARGVALIVTFYVILVGGTAAIVFIVASAKRLGPRVARTLVGVSVIALAAFGGYQLWSGIKPLVA